MSKEVWKMNILLTEEEYNSKFKVINLLIYKY